MSLRTFVMSQLARVMPEPRSTAHEDLLRVDAADEQAYLLQQVSAQHAFLKAFDAEMRLSISRLHEPEENKLIPAQIEQLITMKGRITTVLAMSSVQTLGQAKHKTPLPVVQAKLALDLGRVSGEMEQILNRLSDLHAVLCEMPLDRIITKLGNPGVNKGVLWVGDHTSALYTGKGHTYGKFREGLTKLVLFNTYGKQALLDVYPERRKTIEEIRHDFKHAPIDEGW